MLCSSALDPYRIWLFHAPKTRMRIKLANSFYQFNRMAPIHRAEVPEH